MLTAANSKWSNGGRVTFFNAKSSQAGQWIQAPPAFKKHHPTRLPPPWERFEGLVVSWFLWDADHQTLEEAFQRSSTQSYQISKNHRKKEAPLCLLALLNANRKLAEVSKSAAS